jgi:general secretion pathway protein G
MQHYPPSPISNLLSLLSHLPSPFRRRVRDRHRGSAFTLVEMLAVMFIVSILLAVVLGAASYAGHVAKTSRARADLASLADALDRYRLVFGDYPDVSNACGLVSFSRKSLSDKEADGKDSDYCFSNLLPRAFSGIDPWGTPYRYATWRSGDEWGDPVYSLSSAGPDCLGDDSDETHPRPGRKWSDDDILFP